MHELAIAQGILELIQQYVPEEQAADIRSVRVRIGQLSGVVAGSLDFSFGAMIADTPWQAAKLDLELVQAECHCNRCNADFRIEDLVFCCPGCSGTDIRMISGTELQVVEIELEDGG
jgi:hydrogenase nickel incorporation protein HypA/HybF